MKSEKCVSLYGLWDKQEEEGGKVFDIYTTQFDKTLVHKSTLQYSRYSSKTSPKSVHKRTNLDTEKDRGANADLAGRGEGVRVHKVPCIRVR